MAAWAMNFYEETRFKKIAKLKLRQCTFSTRSRFEIKKNNSSIIFIMLLGSGRQANSSIILIMLLESGRQAGRAAGIR